MCDEQFNHINMKEKLLLSLKTKYKTFGFGDKAFDGVADYLSKTVTEESQIETAISGVEGLLKAFQGDIDTVRNEKSGLQKQLDELKKGEDGKKKEDEEKKDEVPSWAQSLIDSNKTLSTELSALKQKEFQATRQTEILAKAKEYGIPESQAKRYAIPDDADLDSYFTEAKQDLANVGFKGVNPPESPEAVIEKESTEIAKMISQGTKEIVEREKK